LIFWCLGSGSNAFCFVSGCFALLFFALVAVFALLAGQFRDFKSGWLMIDFEVLRG
jgi:hypothetical protein